jgi:hypothetical protein
MVRTYGNVGQTFGTSSPDFIGTVCALACAMLASAPKPAASAAIAAVIDPDVIFMNCRRVTSMMGYEPPFLKADFVAE